MTAADEKVVPIKAPVKRAPRKTAPPVSVEDSPEAKDARITELEKQVHDWETKWQKAWARLNREAKSRGMCSEYDEIAAEIGGVPRYQTIRVNMQAKIVTTPGVEHWHGLLGMAGRAVRATVTIQTRAIEWTMTHHQEVQVSNGECGCGDVNADYYFGQMLDRYSIRAISRITEVTKLCPNQH